jgi:hypothetical protein
MSGNQNISAWQKIYRWTIAVILALSAGALVRIIFDIIYWLSIHQMGILDSGMASILNLDEIVKHSVYAIREAAAWGYFIVVLFHFAPSDTYKSLNFVCKLLYILLGLACLWSALDYNSLDAFGNFGGIIGVILANRKIKIRLVSDVFF